jgi:hypothetical protein
MLPFSTTSCPFQDAEIGKTFWIMHSGQKIDIENLLPSDINLDDIAHHLTKICRYSGALRLNHHYSVANHCLALYYYTRDNDYPIEVQRAILMHDASEAYLGDVNGILKQYLDDYKVLEVFVNAVIEHKYALATDPTTKLILHSLDKRILLDECLAFMPHHYKYFKEQQPNSEPLGITLYPESDLSLTKALFLHACAQLDIK